MWSPYFAPEGLVRGNNEDKMPWRDRFFGCRFGSHILPHRVSQCICRFVYVPVSWIGTCHWQPRGVDKYPCIYSPSHRILLTFRVSTHFSVCQCSDAWELEMVPWKGGAELRNNNRYNLAAQMYQFNSIIYVLFCLLDLEGMGHILLLSVLFVVLGADPSTLVVWRNGYHKQLFHWVICLDLLGYFSSTSNGLRAVQGGFPGVACHFHFTFQVSEQVGLHNLPLSLSFFFCKVQRMPLQSLSKHVVGMW